MPRKPRAPSQNKVGGVPGNKGGSGKTGNAGNAGGSGKTGNTGNAGGSGKTGNAGNARGSGKTGNAGGGAPIGNLNSSCASTKARKLLDQGDQFYRHGKSTDALEKFEAALKIDPKFGDAHNCIGVVLAAQHEAGDVNAGSFSGIREHFEKAILFGCSKASRNLCALLFVGEHGKLTGPKPHVDLYANIMKHMKSEVELPSASAADHHMFAILASYSVENRDECCRLAEDHLRLAVAGDPSSLEYKICLGVILVARGLSDEAAVATVLERRPKYLYALDMTQKLLSEKLLSKVIGHVSMESQNKSLR